jgi:tetratricopeptide (TPR) repeat protein
VLNIQVTPLQPTTDGAIAPRVPNARPLAHIRLPYFALLALTIILLAILRSAITTRLDSFTADENYHVVAGVSYFRTGDYRINPEHPPLVKLWVGAFIPESVLRLPPLKIFNDKSGERTYAAETVYLKNDPDRIQRYARFAMYSFNGILLFVFALVARRVFGDAIALGALIFLAIDPTVAAHMPVVMTDLPVTLIGAIALLSAWLAFQSWKPRAIAGASIALGLTLATKHSGIIFAVFIALFGLYMALRNVPASPENHYGLTPTRRRRLVLLAGLLVGACAVLWSTYRFHFRESLTAQETFNRPLADKITDLESPANRYMLTTIARLHIVPRPFLWGFADIIRQGVESSGFPLYFRDHIYIEQKPLYYFPFQLLVKIPIGLSLFSIAGIVLFISRKTQPEHRPKFWLFVPFFFFFLMTIATSHSQYAGVRHALPLYATLALFAGAALAFVLQQKSAAWKIFALASAAWALASAIPVARPWEYHNALGGGTAHAYLHSSNEGIDLGLRVKDLASYYHRVLEPHGELPYFITYLTSDEELRARGIHTVNQKWDSGELPDDSSTIHGTLIVEANMANALLPHGLGPLQKIEPTERFGNLLIYRGTFDLPEWRAIRLYWRGFTALYAPAAGPAKALPLFEQAAEANPYFYPAWIEIGNLESQLNHRDVAIHAFEQALANAPNVPIFRNVLIDELLQLQTSPDIRQLRPIRDPFAE